MRHSVVRFGTALGLLLMAGAAQAQGTTFTYGELDKSPAAVLARKTLGAHGERFVLLKREEPHGLFRTGERYFTFAQTPTSSFYRGCQTRLAHARYQPLERNGRSEPPQARLKLDDVWFENVFIRLPSAPVYDGSSRFEARMDRFAARWTTSSTCSPPRTSRRPAGPWTWSTP